MTYFSSWLLLCVCSTWICHYWNEPLLHFDHKTGRYLWLNMKTICKNTVFCRKQLIDYNTQKRWKTKKILVGETIDDSINKGWVIITYHILCCCHHPCQTLPSTQEQECKLVQMHPKWGEKVKKNQQKTNWSKHKLLDEKLYKRTGIHLLHPPCVPLRDITVESHCILEHYGHIIRMHTIILHRTDYCTYCIIKKKLSRKANVRERKQWSIACIEQMWRTRSHDFDLPCGPLGNVSIEVHSVFKHLIIRV